MKYSYLILGGGNAAVSAIEGIRKLDQTGTVALVSNEQVLPYSRPMLTKLPLAHYAVERTLLREASWYTENGVALYLGTCVLSLNAETKTVQTSQGELQYEKCIYALGAYNFIPPFSGKDLPGVCSIRTDRDMNRIRRFAATSKNAVVIGGGVIGLEAAYLLREQGLAVTVLETAPYLMPRLLDESCARYLQDRITAFRIYTGVKVLGILGEGRAQAVAVEGMEPIPAELVIVSCGVRANSAVLQAAGAEIDRAVVVNERMETSLPNVYACGDCAQYRGMNTALWAQATNEGQVAGTNAAGGNACYDGSDMALLLSCPEFDLYSDGDCGKRPGIVYESYRELLRHTQTLTVNPRAAETYLHDFYADGKLVGTFMAGSLTEMPAKRKELFGTYE